MTSAHQGAAWNPIELSLSMLCSLVLVQLCEHATQQGCE